MVDILRGGVGPAKRCGRSGAWAGSRYRTTTAGGLELPGHDLAPLPANGARQMMVYERARQEAADLLNAAWDGEFPVKLSGITRRLNASLTIEPLS